MNATQLFLKFLSLLRVHPIAGGLEISDAALRIALSDGGMWHFAGVRLPPGTLEAGAVKDRDQFLGALHELKRQTALQVGNRQIRTIVTLSSANVYSQVFRLPEVSGENLGKAVLLNLDMTSPISREKAYSGWQVVGKDEKSVNLEILSAFVDKTQVDEVIAALEEVGFIVYAVESRALALARLLREQGAGFESDAPSLVLTVDGSGVEFLIIRSGQLFFRYFVGWQEVQGDAKEISWDSFQTIFLRHFRQITNYYGSHWKGELRDVFCIAGNMKEGITRVIAEHSSLQVKELALATGAAVDPEWFVAMGGALRGLDSPHEDREINLLENSARKEFKKREIIGFLKFWRIAVPAALGIFLIGAFIADVYLVRMHTQSDAEADAKISATDRKEIEALQAKANAFNASVAAIENAGKDTFRKMNAFETVDTLFKENEVTLTRFSVQEKKNAVVTNGRAASEDQVTKLAAAFKASGKFQSVNVPLTDIASGKDGVFFSMTLSIIPSKTR